MLSDETKRRRYDQFGHAGCRGAARFLAHGRRRHLLDVRRHLRRGFGGRAGGQPAAVPADDGRSADSIWKRRSSSRSAKSRIGCEKTHRIRKAGYLRNLQGNRRQAGQFRRWSACSAAGRDASPSRGLAGCSAWSPPAPIAGAAERVIRDHCPTCGGTGRQLRQRVVTVKIPAGVHEGQAVRIAGEGEAGENGAPPGDLHCYIAVKPHPIFTPAQQRSGLPGADFVHAGGTGRRRSKCPRSRDRDDLEIPARHAAWRSLQAQGKGLPDLRSYKSGDEFVQIVIEIPRKLTERQKQLLREFASSEDERSHAAAQRLYGQAQASFHSEEKVCDLAGPRCAVCTSAVCNV